MADSRLSRFQRWLPPLGLFLFTLLLWSGVGDQRFTLDSGYFLKDPRVVQGDLAAIFKTDYWHRPQSADTRQETAGLYRPLSLSVMAFARGLTSARDLAADRSPPLNQMLLWLHALGAVLFYGLLLLLFSSRPRGWMWALVGALFGAVHAVGSEVLGTGVGVEEGLVAVLGSGALLCLLLWQRRRRWWWLASHGLLLSLALLAKENALVFVAAGPLMLFLCERAPWRRLFMTAGLDGAVLLAWFGLRFWVLGSLGSVAEPVLAGFSPLARLSTALAVVGVYDLPGLFAPFRYLPNVGFGDLAPAADLLDWRALTGLAVLLGCCAAIWVSWKRDRLITFGLLFGFLAWLPVSNLVVPIGALAATRFLYLPVVGLGLAYAALASRLLAARRLPARLLGGGLLIWFLPAMAVFSVLEVGHWRDQQTLFETAVSRSPSALALRTLAVSLREAGKQERSLSLMTQAAELPLPRIPGTESVPENVLEVAFMASMDVAAARMQFFSDPAGAYGWAHRALKVARKGLQQDRGHAANTNWRKQQGDALSLMGQIRITQAEGTLDKEARALDLRQGVAHLKEALALEPGNLSIELKLLARFQVRGQRQAFVRGFHDLLEKSRPLWSQRQDALQVAMAYAQLLEQSPGGKEAGLRLRLEAGAAGQRWMDPQSLFNLARAGLSLRGKVVQGQVKVLLKAFLQRAGPRLLRERQQAAGLLSRLL